MLQESGFFASLNSPSLSTLVLNLSFITLWLQQLRAQYIHTTSLFPPPFVRNTKPFPEVL